MRGSSHGDRMILSMSESKETLAFALLGDSVCTGDNEPKCVGTYHVIFARCLFQTYTPSCTYALLKVMLARADGVSRRHRVVLVGIYKYLPS
jgi:hypothetical protein